jgi:proprotein convertase subtilisin/kexin type 5
MELDCEFVDENLVKVHGMFAQDLVEGSQIFFMITNFFIAVTEPLTTKSWIVTVFTPEGDFIDRIGSGLQRTFPCFSPCETCSAADPRSCLSCNALTSDKVLILYKNQCLEECPMYTYHDAAMYTCAPCHPNCLDCDRKYGDSCTSCKPNGPLPFLDGTACKAECPFGTYGDRRTNKCENCKAPCQSCVNSADDCSSCDISAGSEARFFMEGVCKSQCEPGYTVPLRRKDFVCEKCSSNCATCAGDNNHCLSCKKDSKPFLSLLDNTCHDSCPPGLTVPVPGEPKCTICSSVCNTCKDTPDHCTSCK